MPTYEFTCKACGNRFEVMVPIAKKADVCCTGCSSRELQEIFGFNMSKSRNGAKGGSCAQIDSCPSRGFG